MRKTIEQKAIKLNAILPELDLLLRCIDSNRNPNKIERLQQFDCSRINWQDFQFLYRSHRVAPMVHGSQEHIHDLPDWVRRELNREFDANQRRIAALNLEISYLHKAFTDAGIQPLLLKGPPLSKQLYGQSYIRDAGDLDWLIPPSELKRAYELLGSLGYRPLHHDFVLTERRWENLIHSKHDLTMIHPERRIINEIHWCMDANKILFPDQFAMEMIQRSTSMPYGQITLQILSNEDLLLYLTYHGSKHIWYCLRWLVDVNEILQGAVSVDWDRFIQTAADMAFQHCVNLALNLREYLWNLPHQELPWMTDKNDAWLFAQSLQSMTSKNRRKSTSVPFHYLKKVYFTSRLKQTKCMLWQSFFPKLIVCDDWEYINFPDQLFFMYAITRPFLWVYRRLIKPKRKRTPNQTGP